MKLNYWGQFVDDNDPFAEYELDGTYDKLIITLVNKLELFKGEVSEWSRLNKIKFIKNLNEYINYNVENFEDFTINNKLVDIGSSDIKLPINILKSLDNNSIHNIVVVGKPGELHYILKNNIRLLDFVNNIQGLVSFSMKTGKELMFIKNYISDRHYIREMYFSDNKIVSEVTELEWLMKYNNNINKNVGTFSSFDYPPCYNKSYVFQKIYASEIEKGIYKVEVRDCDGRIIEKETIEGESLYSVYYQYMIDKEYFKKSEFIKKM